MFHYHVDNLNFAVVLLGLQTSDLTVMENETFLVCVEITDGSLEHDVFIGLAAENSSNAQGTCYYYSNVYLNAVTSCQFTLLLFRGCCFHWS